MYELFTDRARNVMRYANQEAQRLNHEYIGTEHILLGLVKEDSGVAGHALARMNVGLFKIRDEIEKIVKSGEDMLTIGKLPQTPRAKKVIEYAMEEARNLQHGHVGTEHLLLGLLREQEGIAAQVLINLGLKLEDVREQIMILLGLSKNEPEQPILSRNDMLRRLASDTVLLKTIAEMFEKSIRLNSCTIRTLPEGGLNANLSFECDIDHKQLTTLIAEQVEKENTPEEAG